VPAAATPKVLELACGSYLGQELRHFRICFDDHGLYDVVCDEVTISFSESKDDELYP